MYVGKNSSCLDRRSSWLLCSFYSGPKTSLAQVNHSLAMNIEELQELRELVAQLKADNERLNQRPNPALSGDALRAEPGASVAENGVRPP